MSGPDDLELLLSVGENSMMPGGGPRLWGALLYTSEDVELAAYVRTHFSELNALSGPAARVFVVERHVGGYSVLRYWRKNLEPELYRKLSRARLLGWRPYDRQDLYGVASILGLDPENLPCLVFFHAYGRPLNLSDKIIFRIDQVSPAYFRSLFGGVARALRSNTSSTISPNDSSRSGPSGSPPESLFMPGSDRLGSTASPGEVFKLAVTPQQAADAAAFARVRAAEHAIKAALTPDWSSSSQHEKIGISNSQVVVMTGNHVTQSSENFYFQGEKTTFINRPVDTVVRDFQNAYDSVPQADNLGDLLRLVLNSRDLNDAEREEAAQAVHDLARVCAPPQPDASVAQTRIERLRGLLNSAGADIAQPALAILASLAAIFSA
ncbi:hypothetical protein [Streptomyces europaeiscabiei]|uniref:hypothetical protein n=1 Tax=Streptomyces europaeiscabiei TaxID=146819 RepID=UPI002E2C6D26|nr:hypothetical protein [Streptomyces europaeiscabiei]